MYCKNTMPNKISLDEVKAKLPKFVKIIDESYRGVRYKAKFIDLEYNEGFEAFVGELIKLKHGCPSRSNNLRSISGKGKGRAKGAKITLEQFKLCLPSYLRIYEETYRGLRYKSKFRDLEYEIDFEMYCFNIKRDGYGYCKERRMVEFKKKVTLSKDQIQEKLDKIYGQNVIRILMQKYESRKSICEFEIFNHGIVKASLDIALTGVLNKETRYKRELWRWNIKQNWDNACPITGSKVKLQAHHIQSKSSSPELEFDISNGIMLSFETHIEFHSKYGKKFNTVYQLIEFGREKGVDLSPLLEKINGIKINPSILEAHAPEPLSPNPS